MQKPASDIPHEVALFRFSIIADLLSLPVGSAITARIAQKATQVYLIPGTRRTRIAPETIRGWLRQLTAALQDSVPGPAVTAASRGACRQRPRSS